MPRKPKAPNIDLHGILTAGMPGLEPHLGGVLANAASVCLDKSGHSPSAVLAVTGDYREKIPLHWVRPSTQVKQSYADTPEATEFGAAGVAIATIKVLDGFEVVQRSIKGTGFDYWIRKSSDSHGPLFQNCEALEVSGILRGTDADVDYRTQVKRKQAKGSIGKVAVVEFAAPRARIVRI